MKKKSQVRRQVVLQKMMDLAVGCANDAVKLAYLDDVTEVDKLELGCLTEFKRNSNGSVEVKLTDRAAVLVKLLEQLREDEGGAAAFLQALEGGPKEDKGREDP